MLHLQLRWLSVAWPPLILETRNLAAGCQQIGLFQSAVRSTAASCGRIALTMGNTISSIWWTTALTNVAHLELQGCSLLNGHAADRAGSSGQQRLWRCISQYVSLL